MRLTPEKLDAHLAHALQPLYTVLGEEPLLALEAVDRLRQRARAQGYEEREVWSVETGFDWKALHLSCHSQSLFCARKLIELRVPSGKPGLEGGKFLEQWSAQTLPDILLLITLPAMDYRAQQSVWFKSLESRGILIHAKTVSHEQLPAWITRRLSRQQQTVSGETLTFLVHCVEGNLLAAHQEIQKLGLLFPPGPLTHQQVHEAVMNVGRHSLSDLSEALLSQDLARFVRTLRGLQAEEEALPLVLWTFTEDVRGLLQLATARQQQRPLAQAWKEARVWGPRQQLMERMNPRVSLEVCQQALFHSARIDRMIKGVETGDPWESLLELGLRLIQAGAGTRPDRSPASFSSAYQGSRS